MFRDSFYTFISASVLTANIPSPSYGLGCFRLIIFTFLFWHRVLDYVSVRTHVKFPYKVSETSNLLLVDEGKLYFPLLSPLVLLSLALPFPSAANDAGGIL